MLWKRSICTDNLTIKAEHLHRVGVFFVENNQYKLLQKLQ